MQPLQQVQGKNIKNGDIAAYWTLGADQEGVPLEVPRFADKTVHIFSPSDNWNGASVSLQGSIDPNGLVYGNLTDDDKTEITQTADGVPRVVVPNVLSIQPVVTGGDGDTEIIVAIMGRGR